MYIFIYEYFYVCMYGCVQELQDELNPIIVKLRPYEMIELNNDETEEPIPYMAIAADRVITLYLFSCIHLFSCCSILLVFI